MSDEGVNVAESNEATNTTEAVNTTATDILIDEFTEVKGYDGTVISRVTNVATRI